MIPAVLSCIFVLYLYRTLNEPEAHEASNSLVGSSVDNTADLTQRLNALKQRIDRLAESAQRGEP